jgi:hypothetical protein
MRRFDALFAEDLRGFEAETAESSAGTEPERILGLISPDFV